MVVKAATMARAGVAMVRAAAVSMARAAATVDRAEAAMAKLGEYVVHCALKATHC